MSRDTNLSDSDGSLVSRRNVLGLGLAVTGGAGLAALTGSAGAAQNNMYMRDAYIGDSANRDDQIGGRGWLYFETDTGRVFYDDGSGWSDLEIGGETTGPDPTTIDDSSQSYTTAGSSIVYVDTSSTGTAEPVTLTIDSADEVSGRSLEIYDVGEVAGTNSIAIENSAGELVTEIDADRGFTELIYQDSRWLVKTWPADGGVWTMEEWNNAVPDNVIDHFEESLYEDQNKGLADYYSGDLTHFNRQQTTVFEGSYALENDGGDEYYEIEKTDTILEEEIIYSFWIQFNNKQGAGGIEYFTQSGGESSYLLDFSFGNDEVRLLLEESGGNSQLETISSTTWVQTAEWYKVDVLVSSGDHTVTIYDDSGNKQEQLTTTDTTYTSGGYGFHSRNGNLMSVDKITEQ
ncbi:hypothetical protein [Halopiger djelfimassiliensis]|uniref:hypothetical protein n=1 Tax=Halopiger djelfimassiliensis TaxID=1293047 RepID=UPI0012B50953|nr:hypothetical protein [Halopiger djelfimassiliensis]